MSKFSSYEKDKKIFDNWRQFVIKEQQEGFSEETIAQAEKQEAKYKVEKPEDIENIGQLIYYLEKNNSKFKQKAHGFVKSKIGGALVKTGVSALGALLGTALAGPGGGAAGGFKGFAIGEAVVQALTYGLEEFQVADSERANAPVYQIFDLDDELKNLLVDRIGDREMLQEVGEKIMGQIQKIMDLNKGRFEESGQNELDVPISLLVGRINSEDEQWDYAKDNYQIIKVGEKPGIAAIQTLPAKK
jgi:hypothetical protein